MNQISFMFLVMDGFSLVQWACNMTLAYSRQGNNANKVLCRGGRDVALLIHDKLALFGRCFLPGCSFML